MLFTDIIRSKRDGNSLSDAEIDHFVGGLADSSLPAEQVSALAMAISFLLLLIMWFALGL